MTDRPADAFLDGCSIDFAAEEHLADDDIAGLILFADVDPDDRAAVDARAREWAALADAGALEG